MNSQSRKIGIVAGGGDLPLVLADACAKSRSNVFVLAVDEFAEPVPTEIPHQRVPISKLGTSLKLLKAQGCVDLVFVGHFARPKDQNIRLRPDFEGIKFLVRNFGVLRRSNDGIHRAIANTFERKGFRVISPLQAAPDLASLEGQLSAVLPDAACVRQFEAAIGAARGHGATGLGQAIVFSNGRILATETRSGTDAMLQALPELEGQDAFLVKVMSPGQLPTMDPPAIGVRTVELAAQKGLKGILVEAGNSIIVHPQAVRSRADGLGLFIFGQKIELGKIPNSAPKIMLVVGEPSGDALGAQLIDALQMLTQGQAQIVGVGGDLMRAAGMQSLYSIRDTSVMGLREVVPKVPTILRRIRQVAEFAKANQPDIAVMIDSPDFTHKVASRIRKIAPELKVIDYVAPQVWASRPGRALTMAKYFDHVLCLLPFEVPFFQNAGLGASFVGHPVVERVPAPGQGEAFRAAHNIPPDQKILLVLPGSRSNEIRFLWPVFRDAIDQTLDAAGGVKLVLPTVRNVSERVRELVAAWGRDVLIVDKPDDKFGAFDAADVALAASGTVSTELALSATPMVIGYRVGELTAAIARPFLKVPYITLVNLIQDKEVIPEFLQEQCTAQNLSRELIRLLTNSAARMEQVTATAAAVKAMGLGDEKPSVRAAREILKIVSEPSQRRAH